MFASALAYKSIVYDAVVFSIISDADAPRYVDVVPLKGIVFRATVDADVCPIHTIAQFVDDAPSPLKFAVPDMTNIPTGRVTVQSFAHVPAVMLVDDFESD